MNSTDDTISSALSTLSAVTSNAVDATTHIYDTYNYFIHPHWYTQPIVSSEWHYFAGIVITIVGFTGIFGNALVIYIFSSVKTLRTSSNMLLVNLAISDLTFSVVNGFPLFSLSAFNKRWIFGNAACEFYGLIGGIFGLMSINTMAAIAIDRYYAIAKPLQVAKTMTRKKAFFMIVAVWIWSLVAACPPIFGWGHYIPEGFQTSCTFDYLTRTDNNRSFIFFLYIFGFVAPLAIIILCYVFIVNAVRKHENEMKKTAKKLNAEMRTNQDKTRMEIRVTKISFIIVILYMLSWTPYAIVALIGQFGDASFVTPFWSVIPVLFAKASAMHDPIVYALSHPKFRQALYERLPWLMCCCKPEPKGESQSGTFRNKTSMTRGSSVSSAVSNISDTQHADIELRLRQLEERHDPKNVKGAASGNDDIPAGKIIQDLVQALAGVAQEKSTGQQVRPVYLPSSVLQKKENPNNPGTSTSEVSEDQIFVLDNNTLPALAQYLAKFSNLNRETGVSNQALDLSPENPKEVEMNENKMNTDKANKTEEARF